MADNTQLNPGSGGDLLRSEDLGSYKLAVSKIYLGAHGVDAGPVTGSNPLPVSVGNFPASQPVTGTVSVGNFPASQPVTGTVSVINFPATQTVAGSVSVTGTIATTANLNVSGAAVTSGNPIPVANVASMPPGSNLIGAVIARQATGVLVDGTTGVTPKFAAISAASAGDNTIVAAVAGKRLRVVKYTIVTSGGVSAKFRTASGGDLSGAMALAANSGIGGAYCPVGLLETLAGDGLVLNLSSAVPVAGHLTYIEV